MVLDRGQLEAREADGEQRSGLSRSHHRSISILDVGGIQAGFGTCRNGRGGREEDRGEGMGDIQRLGKEKRKGEMEGETNERKRGRNERKKEREGETRGKEGGGRRENKWGER